VFSSNALFFSLLFSAFDTPLSKYYEHPKPLSANALCKKPKPKRKEINLDELKKVLEKSLDKNGDNQKTE
jgi:hypothetical protein